MRAPTAEEAVVLLAAVASVTYLLGMIMVLTVRITHPDD